MKSPLMALALLAGSAAILGGCGKTGDLDRPAPMFGGTPQAASPETRTRMSSEARARADAARTAEVPAPQSIQELRDANQPGAPPPGSPQREDNLNSPVTFNPGQSHPQGSIPDPYGHPSSSPQ